MIMYWLTGTAFWRKTSEVEEFFQQPEYIVFFWRAATNPDEGGE